MRVPALRDIEQDDLAMAVARAVTIANEAATREGMDLYQSIVTVTEDSSPPNRVWRIHYGPREYVLRRGGDLTVLVDERDGKVQRLVRGQ